MARQIKNFWFKLGTMFMTLYFMPLSSFICNLLGLHSNDAHAGTIKCGSDTAECIGVDSETIVDGQTVECTCATNSSLVTTLTCTSDTYTNTFWDPAVSDWVFEEITEEFLRTDACHAEEPCTTNGATRSCTTSDNYNGTQTCTNYYWGGCVRGSTCKAGYVKTPDKQCVASCALANGAGYEMQTSESSSSSNV